MPSVPRSTVWIAVLVVVSAAAATAHGLYEVARGAGVPTLIAALYPLFTDGLALVAYAGTTRLRGSGMAYAWAVVVLGAGLSGLGQATYLAGVESAPTGLRFGVGLWPAVAAAIAAHLLYLLGRGEANTLTTNEGASDRVPSPEPRGIAETAAPTTQLGGSEPTPKLTAPKLYPPAPSRPKPTSIAPAPDGLLSRTRELAPIGRRALAEALGVSVHRARKLLGELDAEQVPRNGHRVLEDAK